MDSTNFRHQLNIHGFKISLLLLVVTLSSIDVSAQMFRPDHDNKKIYFGIMAGFNQSNFRVQQSEFFVQTDSILSVLAPKSPGMNLGIISNLKLNKHFDLRSTLGVSFGNRPLVYEEIGDIEVQKDIESVLIQLPLWLKFKSDRYNNFRFYVLGGARADYDLASNSKKRKAFDLVKLARFDASVDYGIGFQIFFPMFILAPEVTISQGIPNIHVPTEGLRFSSIIDKLHSRTILFKLQVEG